MEFNIIGRTELKGKLDRGDDYKLVMVLSDWEEAGLPLEGDLVEEG